MFVFLSFLILTLLGSGVSLNEHPMAMIKCDECGAKVSDKAFTCPHCGALVGRKKQKRLKFPVIPVLGLAISLGLILVVSSLLTGSGISLDSIAMRFDSKWESERDHFIQRIEAQALAGNYEEVIRLCDSKNTYGDPIVEILREKAMGELQKVERKSESTAQSQ